MDLIRTRQYGFMRTIQGQPPVRVAWVPAAPGAKVFEGWSVFRSYDWSRYNHLPYDGIGRQNPVCEDGTRIIDYAAIQPEIPDGTGEPCGEEFAATGVPPGGPTFETDERGWAPCCTTSVGPSYPVGEPCVNQPGSDMPEYLTVTINQFSTHPQVVGTHILRQRTDITCQYVNIVPIADASLVFTYLEESDGLASFQVNGIFPFNTVRWRYESGNMPEGPTILDFEDSEIPTITDASVTVAAAQAP